ncbi:MAG: ATP-binding protein [Arenicellales bacterium]
MSSLRGKITSAYITLVVGTVLLGIIAFLDLMFLERQVTKGEVVADLNASVLEMRREEKNLFLYTHPDALVKADEHASDSLKLLHENAAFFNKMLSKTEAEVLNRDLVTYRKVLGHWLASANKDRKQIQSEIREHGHSITIAVGSLSNKERQMLEDAVQESKWFLLICLSLIGLIIYVVGLKLKRAAVTPLKRLESSLIPIAKGKFKHLNPPSNEREYITLTDAFNRMLNELEIRQKRMMQSDKLASLGILASGVAHELNNPLSNISSSCQLLIEELDEADKDQLNIWLKQIDSETERGRKIVRALLDFGSQRVFQKQTFKLLDVINETEIIIAKMLQQYSAKLTLNVADDLKLDIDKQRLQQLFINLIQNALYAGGQGVHVKISAILCDRGVSMIPDGAEVAGNLKCITDYDGKFIEILVADDGPGIPSENLKSILDPFFTTSEPGHGVGLGLFIVQEIVREHDGCLAITSLPDKGTQVIILLPEKGL